MQLIRENTPPSGSEINEALAPDPNVSSPVRLRDTTPEVRRDETPTTSQRGETPSSISPRGSVMSRQRRQALKEHKQRRKLTDVIIMNQKAKIKVQQKAIYTLQVKMNRLIKKVSQIPIEATKRQRVLKDI